MSGGQAGPVLVVEDNEDIREGLKMLLEQQGLAVATATDGVDALEQLRSGRRPCLVVFDLMMPRMDGFQLRQLMLDDPKLAQIPAVMLTAAGSVEDRRRAAELDAEILRKPFKVEALLTTVRRLCGGEREKKKRQD